ncbi:MAG TPA: hypothetical protein VMU66_06105 [Gaiellales bacterium]|nr:hypothetical protein [Gaiellales bacterium]
MLATALTAAVIGLAGLALHLRPFAERIDGFWRAGGTFEYPPALAVMCACGIACALALHARGGLGRDTAVVSVVALAAASLGTADRAGLVLELAVVVAFWASQPVVRPVVAWAGPIVALVGVAAVMLLAPSPSRLLGHLGHDPFAGRAAVAVDAVRAMLDRPLAGFGPGGFTHIYAGMTNPPAIALAHDQVLEQGVEAGLAAAAGVLAVLVAGLARSLRQIRGTDPARLAFALSAAVLLLAGLYDFTWSFAPLAATAVIMLGRLASAPPGAG